MAFERGLGPELRACLLKGETTWWQDVVKNDDLAIAIRHKYLNVYSKGQSIFKVKQRDGTLRAETHYKYLVDHAEPEYRSFRDGKFDTDGLRFIQRYSGQSTLDRLIKNAKVYAGNEKEQVHLILRNNPNVIDVEVALTTLLEGNTEGEGQAEEEAEKNRVDRIDIVALEERADDSIWIVFYEVKTFNDPRIRAKENAEVIGTLEDYRQAINQATPDIKKAYREVCDDLVAIQRPVGRPGEELHPLIQKARNNDVILDVDQNPRLVIVDYDNAQWTHERWRAQLKKLRQSTFLVRGWGGAQNVDLKPQAWT